MEPSTVFEFDCFEVLVAMCEGWWLALCLHFFFFCFARSAPDGSCCGYLSLCVHMPCSAHVDLPLTGDKKVALATIKDLKQDKGSTNTAAGLASTGTELFGKDGREKAPKVVILITDGESNAGADPVAAADSLKVRYRTLNCHMGVAVAPMCMTVAPVQRQNLLIAFACRATGLQ